MFLLQVPNDIVQADWHRTFAEIVGTYHHFEWAIKISEGKYDHILEFEKVGMNVSFKVDGLNLGGLSVCLITWGLGN